MPRKNPTITLIRVALLAYLSCFTNLLFALSSVEIETPTHKALVTTPITITGNASATAGISEVLIAIKDKVANLWWQGDRWGELTQHPADISLHADQAQGDWQYLFDPSTASGSGQYTITALVRDQESVLSDTARRPFLVDHSDGIPFAVTIASPLSGEQLTLPSTLLGTATSPFGISSVEIAIKDTVTGSWWQGENWGEKHFIPTETSAVSENEVDWNFQFAPGDSFGSGQYQVIVRAREITNRLSSSERTSFHISDTVALDPAGCQPLTDEQLQSYGYEPVRAYGALGNGIKDDTEAFHDAIDAANENRRVVYLHPGNYLISETLEFAQEMLNINNNSATRFGHMLLGSYCGSEKPTITLIDGTATQVNEEAIRQNPFPVVLFWRENAIPPNTPNNTDGIRDWNQIIRNVHIVLGNNPGAVGIRHAGAEGSSAQEVTIDAEGGFAGIFNLNSSGGYTYNVEIYGGKYGIFQNHHGGGSTLITGLTLSGQTHSPIKAIAKTPLGIVGFDIEHDDGRIISNLKDSEGRLTHTGDVSGHIYLVDGQINITNEGDDPILHNTDRSIYLKNVYVKGRDTIVQHDVSRSSTGLLLSADASRWQGIDEYAYSGPYLSKYGDSGLLIDGQKGDGAYYNSDMHPLDAQITVESTGSLPADLISRHTYEIALCNVEGADNLFVTDPEFGANPNDNIDDTLAIQAAIDQAEVDSSRVFLPASRANTATGTLVNNYRISGTLSLTGQSHLCGVTRYSSILNATAWRSPSYNSPVIRTEDDPDANTRIADFMIEVPGATGYRADGDTPHYNPHVYGINWRAGAGSLYRDVYVTRPNADFGDGRTIIIRGNGGGRWYGITLNKGEYPRNFKFRDNRGNLKMSPNARNLLINGTTQPLTFYPFHCQHMTQPMGALCEIKNAANVTMYGIKSEIGNTPENATKLILQTSNEGLIPVWMLISNSESINLIGHEGNAQTAEDQGLITINNSSNITIAAMGRRHNGLLPPEDRAEMLAIPLDRWYFVLDDHPSGENSLTAQSYISLYKR